MSVIVKMAKSLKHGYSQELRTLKATRERTLIPFWDDFSTLTNSIDFLSLFFLQLKLSLRAVCLSLLARKMEGCLKQSNRMLHQKDMDNHGL